MHHKPLLEDLPEYCSAGFLKAHLDMERQEGLFLPITFGVHVSDEDAVRINRAYDKLRAEGHGKLDTTEELTSYGFPYVERRTQ